ncbi:DUF898 domain-containing protein, partial [Escherichia coli]|nr:DUF898 domain-containing protein [Escherichia coli]
ADRNRSHWSTSKTPSYTKSVSWQHHPIRFHSSVTAIGMLLRMLAVLMGSSITCGLAYPWLKMWMVSWIANNTHVQGDLDSLELTNDDKPQDSGSLMWISRGIMPYVPFI